MSNEIIADLGRNRDLVAVRRKSLCQLLFASAIAISIGGIEKGDAEIKGLVQERDRLVVGEITPPTGRDCP